jgi:hypothetical protein
MERLAFLDTVGTHVPTFDALLDCSSSHASAA